MGECKRKAADELRTMKNEILNLDLAHEMKDHPLASEEEIMSISLKLNKHLESYPDSYGSRGWVKLFSMADLDKSGLIDFDEFRHLLRKTLKVSEWEISDEQLKVLF